MKNNNANFHSINRQSGFAMWLSVFLLLVIGGLVAGGYYLWKQQQAEMDLLHQYVEQIETQLGVKNEAVEQFKQSLAKVAANGESHDVILGDHLRMLEDDMKELDKRMGRMERNRSHENWLLAEVEYLLKMASLRIMSERNVADAMALLRKAESLIREMDNKDQGLVDVRVAISKDIASMEIYRDVDVPGTYAELVAVGDMIEKLPLIKTKIAADDVSAHKDGSEEPVGTLAEINEAFAGYITIRRHDSKELKALLSEEQMLTLRDSIRLSLEHAQTALLRGDQRVYDDSLSRVRRRLLQYFSTDNFRTTLVTERLEKLLKVRVEHDLPDIATSRRELKRYLTDRMRQQ